MWMFYCLNLIPLNFKSNVNIFLVFEGYLITVVIRWWLCHYFMNFRVINGNIVNPFILIIKVLCNAHFTVQMTSQKAHSKKDIKGVLNVEYWKRKIICFPSFCSVLDWTGFQLHIRVFEVSNTPMTDVCSFWDTFQLWSGKLDANFKEKYQANPSMCFPDITTVYYKFTLGAKICQINVTSEYESHQDA